MYYVHYACYMNLSAQNWKQNFMGIKNWIFEQVVIFIRSLADNILLREDGREIVLADFGVARRQTTKVSGLVGTPTHFSPEKAESSGHNYKSDLWASVCVLLHILSGDPPWVKRYPNATALQFLVWFMIWMVDCCSKLNRVMEKVVCVAKEKKWW